MAESFDYVEFARDFESVNGRPPTSEELKEAQTLVGRYVHFSEKYSPLDELEETQVELYKPSLGDRLKAVFSFLGRGLLKAVFLIIQTPIYLTLFFFNLIKSAIGVFVIWFISKFMLGMIVAIIAEVIYGSELYGNPFPSPIKDIVDFILGIDFFEHAVPNFFPHPVLDAWIIGIAIVFFAFALTFSKVEST